MPVATSPMLYPAKPHTAAPCAGSPPTTPEPNSMPKSEPQPAPLAGGEAGGGGGGGNPRGEGGAAEAARGRREEGDRGVGRVVPGVGPAVAGELPLEAADGDALDAAEQQPGRDRGRHAAVELG